MHLYHRIIEYGVSVWQRKEQGPEYYVVGPRPHSQDDQLSAIQGQNQCSFHFTRRPRRDRAQGALPFAPASATLILGPLPLQHNFYFPLCIFRLLKTFFECILFLSLSLWRGKVTVFHSLSAFQNACLLASKTISCLNSNMKEIIARILKTVKV